MDLDLDRDEILTGETVEGVTVIQFKRGGIREEREVLRALERLNHHVEERKDMNLVLDLARIEYLSSAGICHMVGLLKKLRLGGGSLKLCNLRPTIMELFEVMRLTQVFDIEQAESEAVDAN